MKLSVIVPVYNVEATLRRTLDSIVRQNMADMEIILVDDGSTDGSKAICNDFIARHDKAKLICQSNAGLGAARNAGMAIAQGEWLYFIDSDDDLADETLPAVIDEAEKQQADIAEFPYKKVYDGYNREERGGNPEPIGVAGSYSPMDYWLSTLAWRHTYAWNKLFRRSLFATVKWVEGVRFEDAFTLPLLLNQARRVTVASKGLHYYHINQAGLSATATCLHTEQLLTAQWRVLKKLLGQGEAFCKVNKRTLAICYADIVNIQLTALKQGSRQVVLPILPYRQTLKLKLLHLLGFRNLARLCSFRS